MTTKHTFTALLCLIGVTFSTHAQHWGDLAGDAPAADITGDKLILNNSTTGRQVELTLSANAIDIDQHLNSCGGHDPVLDPIAQYQWVVPANITLQAPVNLTGATVTFTTANAAGVNGDVEIKIKDAGDHFQDLANVTLVDTQNIKLVDPDEFAVVTVTETTAHGGNPVNEVQVGSTTEYQLKYQNVDLPWVGRIQKSMSGRAHSHDVATNVLAPSNAGQTFSTVVTSDDSGSFTFLDKAIFHINGNNKLSHDEETNGISHVETTAPAANNFSVHAYKRHVVNVENNNTEFGTPKSARQWLDDQLQGHRSY